MLSIDKKLNKKTDFFVRGDTKLEYLFLPKSNAETVVFIHGLGADLRYFWPHISYISSNFQILAVSLRGHGKSFKPQPIDSTNYSVAYQTLDVLMLLDFLGIYQFVLVGHHLGGLIGFELMSRLPERLICVIAVSASGLVDYPLWVKFLSGGMFTMSAGMGVEKFTRVYLKNMSKQTEVKNFVSGLEKPDMAVLSAVNKSLSDYSYLDTIKTSTVPMMYLVGEDDPDLVNMNKTIEAINENEGGLYDYGVLSGAGPLLNLDKFDEFNAILVNYLNVLC